jgi:predicted MPP superfamily phosphohydrolase
MSTKIIQLSDLHNGDFKWFEIIKEEKPDIIACTGDMVGRQTRDFSHIYRVLSTLNKIAPVLYSLGNHELTLGYPHIYRLKKAVEKTGTIWLDNEVCRFGDVYFFGATLTSTVYRKYPDFDGLESLTPQQRDRIFQVVCGMEDLKISYRNLDKYTAKDLCRDFPLSKLPENFSYSPQGRLIKPDNAYVVLLAHAPFFFPEYAKWGADLTLSGHVHGGLVRLPLVGGVLSPERKLFPKYDKGVYQISDKKGNVKYMHVSVGLNKWRVFNPPEIGIIEV